MRVDKFVIQHLNYLDGKLKLAYAEHNKTKNIMPNPEITKSQLDSTVKSTSTEKKTQSLTYTSNKTSFSTTKNEIQVTVDDTKQFSSNEIEKNVSWTNNEIKIIETSTSSTISSLFFKNSLKLSNNTLSSELESIAHYAKTSTPLKEEPQKEKKHNICRIS